MNGLDLLGVDASSARAIRIRVRNAVDLAKQKGGVPGAVAAALAPQAVENRVLDEMASQMSQEFRKQGVNADVAVVDDLTGAPVDREDKIGFGTGVVLGAGAIGVGWVFWRWLRARLLAQGGSSSWGLIVRR